MKLAKKGNPRGIAKRFRLEKFRTLERGTLGGKSKLNENGEFLFSSSQV